MNNRAMSLANDYAQELRGQEALSFADLATEEGIKSEDFQILRNSTNYPR